MSQTDYFHNIDDLADFLRTQAPLSGESKTGHAGVFLERFDIPHDLTKVFSSFGASFRGPYVFDPNDQCCTLHFRVAARRY